MEIVTSKEPGLQTQEQEPASRPGRACNWVLHGSYRYRNPKAIGPLFLFQCLFLYADRSH